VDYADEDDAAAKLKCAMSITSILTALYANSPIVDGAVSEYQSYRSAVWLDVDPDRCGLLPLAFEDGDLFRRYVEYALDVPMFFVARRGAYSPARGTTFRRFLADGFEGERATLNDWEIHLSTLFPEARIKRFMEVRGCDGGSHAMIVALGPLCLGLLYDDAARADATALTAGLSFGEREQLARDVCTGGLSARVAGRNHTLGDLARQLVDIAADGLSRVAPDEAGYLEPVRAIAQTGRTQADAVVDAWNAAGGDVAAAISSFRRFA
jgi:glutamate--cysteine ligase